MYSTYIAGYSFSMLFVVSHCFLWVVLILWSWNDSMQWQRCDTYYCRWRVHLKRRETRFLKSGYLWTLDQGFNGMEYVFRMKMKMEKKIAALYLSNMSFATTWKQSYINRSSAVVTSNYLSDLSSTIFQLQKQTSFGHNRQANMDHIVLKIKHPTSIRYVNRNGKSRTIVRTVRKQVYTITSLYITRA